MTDLVIIRGLPGAGKTTFAKSLQKPETEHFEADMFFEKGGKYRFDRRWLGAAHDWCYGNVMDNLHKGRDVIVANTFSTRREIERYVNGVKKTGKNINVYVVKCVGNDQMKSVHNVPDHAIARMADRWEDWPGEKEFTHE